jgi:hypothetical protein
MQALANLGDSSDISRCQVPTTDHKSVRSSIDPAESSDRIGETLVCLLKVLPSAITTSVV